MKNPMLTIAEAAAQLAISEGTLRAMVNGGNIPHYRIGNGRGQIRFAQADLDIYLARQRHESAEDRLQTLNPRLLTRYPDGRPLPPL